MGYSFGFPPFDRNQIPFMGQACPDRNAPPVALQIPIVKRLSLGRSNGENVNDILPVPKRDRKNVMQSAIAFARYCVGFFHMVNEALRPVSPSLAKGGMREAIRRRGNSIIRIRYGIPQESVD